MKKKVMREIDKISNGDSDTNLNNFVEENIPPITFGVLNRESRSSFNESK